MSEQGNNGNIIGSISNRRLIIGGAAVVVLVIIVTAVLLLLRLVAGADSIARVMPPDTSIYMEVNVSNLDNDETKRVVNAFGDAFDEANLKVDTDKPESIFKELDDQLDDAFDLTITDDVLPWIGPRIGAGLVDVDVRDLTGSNKPPDWIVAATVRDKELADTFIEDLIASLEDATNNDINDDEYKGVTTYEMESDVPEEQIAFARSDGIFLLAANIDVLEDAIKAQKGDSLADTDAYKKMSKQLPDGRALIVFFDGKSLQDVMEAAQKEAMGDAGGDFLSSFDFTAMAMALTFVEQGIQLDFAAAYDNLSDEQQTILDAQTARVKTDDFLPEETFVYFVGQRLDVSWEVFKKSLKGFNVAEDEFDEAMNIFDDTFGFNPDDDLFPLLDGEYALALIPSRDGVIASGLDVDLGLVALFGSSDTEELNKLVEDFVDGVEDQGFDTRDSTGDDLVVYEVEDPSGELVGAFGVGKDYLVLGTSADDIEAMFDNDAPLAKSGAYRDVWKAFPGGTVPLMYINLAELLDEIDRVDPDVKTAADLSPITAIAIGTQSDDNLTQSTLILFVGEQ